MHVFLHTFITHAGAAVVSALLVVFFSSDEVSILILILKHC